MAEELEDKLTQVTIQQMADAFHDAWCRYWGVPPEDPHSVLVLLAQWALETGRGKSMHNFNVGNVKAKPGGSCDWQFYECGEKLSKADAEARQKADPRTARIQSYNDDGTCWIKFVPRNPAACFRAFRSLEEGVFDHLMLLIANPRYQAAWPNVVYPDPVAYSRALHAAGYYTAPEPTYTTKVVSLFNEFQRSVVLPEAPLFDADEVRRIEALVQMSLDRMAEEAVTGHYHEDDEQSDDVPNS